MANHYTRQVPEISEQQRQQLQGWLRRRKTSQALALRARIVLQCAQGESDLTVAAALGTTRATVGKWRRRFLRDGCDGLLDEPRPGTPRTVSDADVERVVTRTLESLPRGGDAVEHALDGAGQRPESCDDQPHLAGVRAQAAPHGDVQAVARPAVHRESAGYRGAVPVAAGAGGGAVR